MQAIDQIREGFLAFTRTHPSGHVITQCAQQNFGHVDDVIESRGNNSGVIKFSHSDFFGIDVHAEELQDVQLKHRLGAHLLLATLSLSGNLPGAKERIKRYKLSSLERLPDHEECLARAYTLGVSTALLRLAHPDLKFKRLKEEQEMDLIRTTFPIFPVLFCQEELLIGVYSDIVENPFSTFISFARCVSDRHPSAYAEQFRLVQNELTYSQREAIAGFISKKD
jgi:hypothetical protein